MYGFNLLTHCNFLLGAFDVLEASCSWVSLAASSAVWTVSSRLFDVDLVGETEADPLVFAASCCSALASPLSLNVLGFWSIVHSDGDASWSNRRSCSKEFKEQCGSFRSFILEQWARSNIQTGMCNLILSGWSDGRHPYVWTCALAKCEWILKLLPKNGCHGYSMRFEMISCWGVLRRGFVSLWTDSSRSRADHWAQTPDWWECRDCLRRAFGRFAEVVR